MAFTYGTVTYAKDSNGTTIGGNVYEVRLGFQLNSQNIENNISNITLQLEVRSTNSQYITYGYNQTTTIDGTALSAKTFDFRNTNVWQIFGTRTFNVTHNADGTYSVNKNGSFTTTASGAGRPNNGSASVTVTLPTIPRASSITVNDANIGSSTNIVINKASSSFTTTIEYSTNNSNWTTIVSKTSNQVYGWTVPTSFYDLIHNTKTMTCYFRATTYSDNTSVGTTTTTAKFTATGNPTIPTRTGTDINSITANLTTGSSTSTTKMVKYASNIRVSVTATARNSAYISKVTVNGSNVSLDGSSTSTTRSGTITFNGATTNSFSVVATDSRGYSTTQNISNTLTVVNYVPLTITQNIKRNTPTDGKINISLSGNYYNSSFGNASNTLTVQYRFTESGKSTWDQGWTTGNVSPTISGNTYTYLKTLTNMDYTKSYNFEVRATDKIGTKTITGITITKGQPIFYWNNNGLYVIGDLKKNGSDVALVSQIPTVNNATLTIQKNGSTVKTFTANASSNVTANITVPTKTSDLTNDSNFGSTTGTSGIWTYIKFNSGYAVCFAREEKSITVSNSFGDWKTSANQTIADFPFNFTSIPIVSRWIDGSNSGIAMNDATHKASVSNAGGYQVARGTTITNGNFIVNTIAVGFWK